MLGRLVGAMPQAGLYLSIYIYIFFSYLYSHRGRKKKLLEKIWCVARKKRGATKKADTEETEDGRKRFFFYLKGKVWEKKIIK